jgi:hypothetical protein
MFALVVSISCTIAASLPQVDWVAYYQRQATVGAQQWPSSAWQMPQYPGFIPPMQSTNPTGRENGRPGWVGPTMQWAAPNNCPKPLGEAR